MVRIKKYKSYKGRICKAAPNILARNFNTSRPNKKWVTDVTEFHLHGQRLYFSPILDLYNGEVISYNISERPVFAQIDDMLDKAFDRIPDNTGLILHSDQGWQYQLQRYKLRLRRKGIVMSMSRKGIDNAAMESFFCYTKIRITSFAEI